MSNRTHIINELQSITPGLASIPATMPYSLPQEYFSNLASEMLFLIKNEAEPLLIFSKVMPYTIPVDYFEQLPANILLKTNLLTAASGTEVDFWNQIAQTTPYTVPSGYFENFPVTILQKIKRTEQIQTVPTGYFEVLPEMLLAKVRMLDTGKELEEIAPLLNTISKVPVQHIPADYFHNLQPIVSNENQSAPIVSIGKRTNWLKYAVAASVVLFLGISSYFLITGTNTAAPSVANQPTVKIINEELANLDASTIEDYLKTNNALTQMALPTGGVEELSNGNLDELLQDFTDQQLKRHIEETPELPTFTKLKNHT